MNASSLFKAVALSGVFALTACDDAPAAASGPAVPAPAAKKKVEAAAPVVVTSQVDYVYNAINKRDPFRGTLIDTRETRSDQQGGNAPPCDDPLCQLDLDELTVVAVVSGDANPLAMVEDRKGVGHIVRRNTKMGKAGGKVTQVLRECLVVTSFVSGGADGKPIAKKDEMCVKTTDSRTQPALDLLRNKEFSQ